jgi:hypothetical protein
MGANQSTVTPDQFKDHIFSIVLYYIAPKANPTLKFVTRDRCGPDFLPIPDEPDLTKLLNFYNPLDPQVAAYLNKHILNSEENMVRFYQTLIGSIRNTDDIPINHDGKLLHFGGGGGGTGMGRRDPPDPLTRSRLGELDNPKRRSANNKQNNPIKPDRTGTERPIRKDIPLSIGSVARKPTASMTDTNTNKSSHFTMSKVVEDASVSPSKKNPTGSTNNGTTATKGGANRNKNVNNVANVANDINFTNSELEATKQKLIVNLLKRAEPYQYHEDENYVEEEPIESNDDNNSNTYSSRKDSRPDSRKNSRPDSRPDSRKNSRPDSRKDSRLDSRPDSREHSRPDSRVDSREHSRVDSRVDSRMDSRQVSRVDSRMDSRQVSRVDSRSVRRDDRRNDKGRDSRDKGRDSRDKGRDSRDKGRDSRDKGRDSRDKGRDRNDSRLYNESAVSRGGSGRGSSKFQGYEESKKDEISVTSVPVQQFGTDLNKEIDIHHGSVVSRDDDHTSHPKEVYYDDADEQTMKHAHRFREKCVIEDFD